MTYHGFSILPSRPHLVSVCVAAAIVLLSSPADAQRREAEVYNTYGGDPMYTVLPPGTIPAIDEPEFVTGPDAHGQMSPDESVLGLVINGEARAYSLWQLDAHEIVNDVLGGVSIAATW